MRGSSRQSLWYAALWGLSTAEAFTTTLRPPMQRASVTARSLHGGWDNDDFMDSLGKGQDEQNQANDQYYSMSRYGRPEEQPWAEPLPSLDTGGAVPPTENFNQQRPPQAAYLNQQQASPPLPNQDFNQQLSPQEQYSTGFGQQNPPQSFGQNAPQYPPQSFGQNALQYPPQGSPPLPQQQQGVFANVGQQNTIPPLQHQSVEKDGIPMEDMQGAVLTDEMKAKAKASHTPEEEASQGGEKFRSLMARARKSAPVLQSAQTQQPSVQVPPNAMTLSIEEQARLFREIMMQRQQQQQPPLNPYAQQQQPNPYAPPPQQQPQMPNAFGQQMQTQILYSEQQQQSNVYGQQSPNAFDQQNVYNPQPPNAYGEQIQAPTQQMQPNAYGQYTQQQPDKSSQQGTAQYSQQQPNLQQQNGPAPKAPANYLGPGIAPDGRRIGHNRDADLISNEADVYLAQLKKDSTSRNLARYAGDTLRANQVFHDSTIQDIQAPPENPYMKEQREKMMDMIETVPEEMLVFTEFGKGEGDKSSSGISYREKLAQIKAQKAAAEDKPAV